MGLAEIRKNIDLIDSKILKLLYDRMEQVLMAGKLKFQVEDRAREQDVLDRMRDRSTGLLNGDFIEKIYSEIFKESKTLQQKGLELIAFQGEHGAYGEVASRAWNSNLVPVACLQFAGVLEGVESGFYDYGIVPVENTLGGSVEQVNRLLLTTPLQVVGSVALRVRHCLLAAPGSDHREIRTVYSHPQALAQSRRFLLRNKLEPVPYHDTAGAAKMVAEQRPKGAAAIAGELSAKLYGLEIIKENVADLDRNITRFLVLSRTENKEEGHKCSIIFSTEHKAGTLFRVLEVFSKENINLTRIESMPHEPGNYAFFLDFEGSHKERRVIKALDKVQEITSTFKMMGCYNERNGA